MLREGKTVAEVRKALNKGTELPLPAESVMKVALEMNGKRAKKEGAVAKKTPAKAAVKAPVKAAVKTPQARKPAAKKPAPVAATAPAEAPKATEPVSAVPATA